MYNFKNFMKLLLNNALTKGDLKISFVLPKLICAMFINLINLIISVNFVM